MRSQFEKSEITVQVVHSALIPLLDYLLKSGIPLRNVVMKDELTAVFEIDRTCWNQLSRISRQKGAEMQLLNHSGIYWHLKAIASRPILLIGVFLLLLLSLILSRRILVVTVEGNTTIPDKLILEAAQNAGIFVGVSRNEIRSENAKNQLLEMLPQLQWVGINTRGCIATVSAKERTISPSNTAAIYGNIVASTDGIIRSVNVTKGNQLCGIGQAVKAGDILVSAYTDCGVVIKATGAEGEVYAETLRQMDVVIPLISTEKGKKTETIRKYSLLIGKKQIKFYKDSGIYDTTCDKMYEEYYITLPKGLQLPIAVIVEQWDFYESCATVSQPMMSQTVKKSGEAYLLQEMVAGQILSAQTNVEYSGTVCRITGTYRCLEMIGRLQQEEITIDYGKNS